MDKLVTIVIPVYTAIPDENEQISLRRNLQVLAKYPFALVCPQSLDVQFYIDQFAAAHVSYSVQRFDNEYFKSIYGYNQLLLSSAFYRRFEYSRYILICQLDAYIFRDELTYWCNCAYDYIGAPWMRNFRYTPMILKGKVGNGGLSLRRTRALIDLLEYPYPLKSFKQLWAEYHTGSWWKRYLRLPLLIAKSLGYQNTMAYCLENCWDNEDVFLCAFLETTRIRMKTPSAAVAARFSMDTYAEQLYHQSGQVLPFGCHAWYKAEYAFWQQFIS
ncbi:MAG: hypothetical protein LBR66_07590 [Candidatus Symbiothrix sp.]|jgi:hypothetical protein|nr:hypothetical protein [Candidatus Symbiothrix sp.]